MNRKQAKEAMERCEEESRTFLAGMKTTEHLALEMLGRAMETIQILAETCGNNNGVCKTCSYTGCMRGKLLAEWDGEGE